jgi:hypothetical protein
VLLAVCIGLAAVAGAVTVRWGLARIGASGRRPPPFPALTVGVPAVAALVCAVPVVRHAQLETRLGQVASILAGVGASVKCETAGQAWLDAHPERGYVPMAADGKPSRQVVVTYDTCNDLAAWIASDHRAPTQDQVVAVHVLSHEAMHVAGSVDEATAECAALQRDTRTAMLLGATTDQARALARHYLLTVYPTLPDTYRSPACVAGGGLDEHLENSPWS